MITDSASNSSGTPLFGTSDSKVGETLRLLSENPSSYFMGVSLSSTQFFSKKTVRKYLEHYEAVNTPFVLLVADSLEAINYQYLRGASVSKANVAARSIGQTYLSGYSKLTQEFPKFRAVSTSAIERRAEFHKVSRLVMQEFRRNMTFRREVQAEVIRNLGSRGNDRLARIPIGRPRIEGYVLGEIAHSLFLYSRADRGTRIMQVSRNRDSILNRSYVLAELFHRLGIEPFSHDYLFWNPEDADLDVA